MNPTRGTAAPLASRWVPPVLWAGVILAMTSWPAPDGIPNVTGLDKVAHFSVYAVLGALVARAIWPVRAKRRLAVAALALGLFGAIDEWHQNFIPGRDASLADWLADSSGALVGLACAPLLLRLAPARQDLPS